VTDQRFCRKFGTKLVFLSQIWDEIFISVTTWSFVFHKFSGNYWWEIFFDEKDEWEYWRHYYIYIFYHF